ncbi:rho guanine nucleotide exchange factor 33 [Platysternon megacephalum]|uniref:Rho guanine nucleotide exchange factor 33 n=1 Tax=Platysternon megacephalum TaxID=55544 RepID=A0A4D9DR24_9SAUR|nr:rho guanine nucleotide exchange factor 33 [Platysternon megacephalum]
MLNVSVTPDSLLGLRPPPSETCLTADSFHNTFIFCRIDAFPRKCACVENFSAGSTNQPLAHPKSLTLSLLLPQPLEQLDTPKTLSYPDKHSSPPDHLFVTSLWTPSA